MNRFPVGEKFRFVIGDEGLNMKRLIFREIAAHLFTRENIKGRFLALIPGVNMSTVMPRSLV